MTDREKFIKHAETEYSSSPYPYTEDQLQVIEDSGYKCDRCGKSVFEMWDAPFVRDNEVFCEDCYNDECQERCPVCEELFEPEEGMEEYFFLTKRTAELTSHPVGMYRVLEHPFFYGDCVSGFTAFCHGAIEQVNNLDIEDRLRKEYGLLYCGVATDIICPECAKKYKEIELTTNNETT